MKKWASRFTTRVKVGLMRTPPIIAIQYLVMADEFPQPRIGEHLVS
jgi:hypothetical protein